MKKKEQFSKLYDDNVKPLFRYILLKVGSKEVAEDLTSQSFTKLWEKLEDGKDIKNPHAYVYKIARSEIADHHRANSKFEIVNADIGDFHDLKCEKVSDPAQKQTIKSEAKLLHKNLENLKDEYQDVVILRYLQDMPYKQIAQIVDRPKGTIRVMVHRALKKLKDQLEEDNL